MGNVSCVVLQAQREVGMKRPIVVTVFFDPTELMLDSVYAPRLTFREWCEREVSRINATAESRPAEIEQRASDGWIRVIRR